MLVATGRPLPVYVSSSQAAGISTSSFTVTAPTGIQDGYLIVAIIRGKNRTNNITPPTGFINHFVLNDVLANSNFVYTKVAASESGNYTWTFSDTGSAASAIMLVYKNATRINTIGTYSSTNIASSITPTYPGVLLATFAVDSNADTVTTPPAGMTLRELCSPSGEHPSMAVYELSPQEAVATGTKTIVWAGGAHQDLSQLLQITNETNVAPEYISLSTQKNSATGNTLVINKPTGTIENDIMIAVMGSSSSTSFTWTGDTDWVEVAEQNSGWGSTRIAYKIAGASEGSSYTFTGVNSSWVLAGSILTYRYGTYDTVSGLFEGKAGPVIMNVSPLSPTSSQSVALFIGTVETGSSTISCAYFSTSLVLDNDATAPSFIVKMDPYRPIGSIGEVPFVDGGLAGGGYFCLSIKPTRTPS